jgi:GNAT superfamily N-acetyltransferase
MKTKQLKYEAERDFLRVRNFLKKNHYRDGKPWNWDLERWNWARFHPSMFCEQDTEKTATNIAYWESIIRIWEDSNGEIIAVVNTETPITDGEAFIHRSTDSATVLEEVFTYIEQNMAHPESGKIQIPFYEYDAVLTEKMLAWGYTRDEKSCWHNSEFDLQHIPMPNLKKGFTISSIDDNGDLVKYCKGLGLGFNHTDPAEWSTPAEYNDVHKAPDYNPNLNLFVEANGEYVCCCCFWYDDYNKIGFLEPLATQPDYRRMGLGRELVYEGLSRIKKLGGTKAYVGSSLDFYKSIGFELKYPMYDWKKCIRQ